MRQRSLPAGPSFDGRPNQLFHHRLAGLQGTRMKLDRSAQRGTVGG